MKKKKEKKKTNHIAYMLDYVIHTFHDFIIFAGVRVSPFSSYILMMKLVFNQYKENSGWFEREVRNYSGDHRRKKTSSSSID